MMPYVLCRLRQTLHRFLHTSMTRDPRLATLQDSDIARFKEILGTHGVLTKESELGKYNRDWLKHHEGNSKVVLFPRSTAQVSSILQHCHTRRLAVVPQGGNTGLVQGSIPMFDEIILSSEKLNKIISFDGLTGVLVCQAGCILEVLDNFVAAKGFTVPLDLGAKGSCHIGGNLATNAGGIRLLRYGSLHGSVLGMDVVLANGDVLEMMSTLRKDNTGYDIKQLFIGSEGTLGIITAASLQCPPRSLAQNTCLLSVKDFPMALALANKARQRLGEIISALEFMDSEAYRLPFAFYSDLIDPLHDEAPSIYLLIETFGANDDHDKEKLHAFLEMAMEEGIVTNGVIAQDLTQIQNMWKIRECINHALASRGAIYKYDLSLPLDVMYTVVEEMRQRLKAFDCLVVAYGHLGDANLHLNISTKAPSRSQALLQCIEPFIYQLTAEHKGSISAEHGLGAMKANCIGYSKSCSAIQWMQRMKHLFDPLAILNPYKVLPSSFGTDLKL